MFYPDIFLLGELLETVGLHFKGCRDEKLFSVKTFNISKFVMKRQTYFSNQFCYYKCYICLVGELLVNMGLSADEDDDNTSDDDQEIQARCGENIYDDGCDGNSMM